MNWKENFLNAMKHKYDIILEKNKENIVRRQITRKISFDFRD